MAQSAPPKPLNLALQGGGAHGAFAWGVLDALLEDGRVTLEGICATSAGTMNALALGYGLHLGAKTGDGPERARERLEALWRAVSDAGRMSPLRLGKWPGFALESTAVWSAFDALSRMVSPYQWNPFDYNPLKDVLERVIDFDDLRCCWAAKLFISATDVETGKVRVFENSELTIDVALASACLPYVFKAVEIDGRHYWDGGFMGNPALYPLFYRTDSRDVMIIHINPIERAGVPKTAAEINNRLNEISFNNSLLKELRAIAFVKKLVENDMLKDGYEQHFKDVLVHSIRAERAMCAYSVASKFDTSWPFLTELRDRGRQEARHWLDHNADAIGHRDTVDLHGEFLGSVSRMFAQADKDAAE